MITLAIIAEYLIDHRIDFVFIAPKNIPTRKWIRVIGDGFPASKIEKLRGKITATKNGQEVSLNFIKNEIIEEGSFEVDNIVLINYLCDEIKVDYEDFKNYLDSIGELEYCHDFSDHGDPHGHGQQSGRLSLSNWWDATSQGERCAIYSKYLNQLQVAAQN